MSNLANESIVLCRGRYMSKMDGCSGKVVLAHRESSFKRWGIEIQVRFRSEEDQGKLSVLNKLVHSGGERSVSTILYLMALQVKWAPLTAQVGLSMAVKWKHPYGDKLGTVSQKLNHVGSSPR